ncbi:3601_t:CDS:10 [Paraglomus occultum]|uniref:3601_t:CDS:1 n=1 Tax=Paraglomus occultum TaxID=144539 RepID=A0A9N9BZC7_9GLOM|nr:3601_t:CDS:10 [Paraglomus occultum]
MSAEQPRHLPDKELDKIVLNYLTQKGYKHTELMFRNEIRAHAGEDYSMGDMNAVSGYQFFPTDPDSNNPDSYISSYADLRKLIERSMDIYKLELRLVMFPVFAHIYLDLVFKGFLDKAMNFMEEFKSDHYEYYGDNIRKLSIITHAQHLQENEFAITLRSQKYNVRLSNVSTKLLLNFLQENKLYIILRIVNQYLEIEETVNHQQTLMMSDIADVTGVTGYSARGLDDFNKQKVFLGPLPPEPTFMEEAEQVLKVKDTQLNSMDPQSLGDDDLSTLLEDITKDFKDSIEAPDRNDVPLPPSKGSDIQAKIEELFELRHRIKLGASTLPSICFYTFHNTYDSLNCISISDDATLIAGGFSESYIKIWSLKGEKLKAFMNNVRPTFVSEVSDLERLREQHGSECKRLVGHSGPVFGLSFSPDNRYLVTCSEDKTARLWSVDTFTNLVCYKGHNYPIWDVDFGPYGFYFATASYDRTARLWSCDHIYPLRIFAGHLSDVDCVKFHPNSRYVLTGSSDRMVRMWDIQTGRCVRIMSGHAGAVQSLAVSDNGHIMASAGEDKKVILRDLRTGKTLRKLTGHTDIVYTLEFSRGGNLLVSGGADQTVRVWDVNACLSDQSDYNTSTTNMENGTTGVGQARNSESARVKSDEMLATFPTKRTPVYKVKFTRRNLCLAAGAFTKLSEKEQ